MRVRRICAALVTVVFAASQLSGCGSTAHAVIDAHGNKNLPVIGESVKYDPNHLVNNGTPITVQYWSWYGAGSDPVIDMIDAYQKIHPNVTIEPVTLGWYDYWTKLPIALRGGNGPALFNVQNAYDALIRPNAADYDIDVHRLEADYSTASVHVQNGAVKYIDAVIDTGNIYYNKKIWRDVGLTDADIPKTWDEFRRIAQRLTKYESGKPGDGSGKKMVQAGFVINSVTYALLYAALNYQQGELLFTSDGTTPNYDNPVTAENLRFVKDLYDRYHVGSLDLSSNCAQTFGLGKAAMVYGWGWFETTLRNGYPDVEYGIFPTPVPSETKTPFAYDRYNGQATPGINARTSPDRQAVAQDFVRYLLANDDYIRKCVETDNAFPAKRSLTHDPQILSRPAMKAIAPRVERLIWPGPMPDTMDTSARKAFENVFYNQMPIEQALAQAQRSMVSDVSASGFHSAENRYRFYDERRPDQQ